MSETLKREVERRQRLLDRAQQRLEAVSDEDDAWVELYRRRLNAAIRLAQAVDELAKVEVDADRALKSRAS